MGRTLVVFSNSFISDQGVLLQLLWKNCNSTQTQNHLYTIKFDLAEFIIGECCTSVREVSPGLLARITCLIMEDMISRRSSEVWDRHQPSLSSHSSSWPSLRLITFLMLSQEQDHNIRHKQITTCRDFCHCNSKRDWPKVKTFSTFCCVIAWI